VGPTPGYRNDFLLVRPAAKAGGAIRCRPANVHTSTIASRNSSRWSNFLCVHKVAGQRLASRFFDQGDYPTGQSNEASFEPSTAGVVIPFLSSARYCHRSLNLKAGERGIFGLSPRLTMARVRKLYEVRTLQRSVINASGVHQLLTTT
jgi:hypothetical protein